MRSELLMAVGQAAATDAASSAKPLGRKWVTCCQALVNMLLPRLADSAWLSGICSLCSGWMNLRQCQLQLRAFA